MYDINHSQQPARIHTAKPAYIHDLTLSSPPQSLEPEEPTSLESDIVASDPAGPPLAAGDSLPPPGPDQSPEADPVEEIVPIFPGAPDAPSMPVSSAPKPLPSGDGVISPDPETVVVSARGGEFSASGGRRPQQQFPSRPREGVGALRLRGASRAPAELALFAAASAPERVSARNSDSTHATPPAPALPTPSSWLTRLGDTLPPPAVRVSDEAARAGRLPVAERHSLAQVRPSQRRPQDETAPLLDDPVLYRYSSLLHAARRAAAPPRIVVV